MNKNNNNKVTGDDINKELLAKTDNSTPKINATVNGHVLSTDQIPEHNHLGGVRKSMYGNSIIHCSSILTEAYFGKSESKTPLDGYPFAVISVTEKGGCVP